MTRINVIPPASLSREHLVAEYRELPRVFGLVLDAAMRGERPDDPRNPREYCLGAGHVRFFYPRCKFLANRFYALVEEMEARGYAPNFLDVPPAYNVLSRHWCQDYTPTPDAIAINLARLRERDPEHYHDS